jgi:hypothetical protein
VSADDALRTRVEAALVRRFRGVSAAVVIVHSVGHWRGRGVIRGAAWRVEVAPTQRHARRRDAIRAVAHAAEIADDEIDGGAS